MYDIHRIEIRLYSLKFYFSEFLVYVKNGGSIFLGVVIILGCNLTERMEPQLINLRMRLNPNFFSKTLEKLGLSLIFKLIS